MMVVSTSFFQTPAPNRTGPEKPPILVACSKNAANFSSLGRTRRNFRVFRILAPRCHSSGPNGPRERFALAEGVAGPSACALSTRLRGARPATASRLAFAAGHRRSMAARTCSSEAGGHRNPGAARSRQGHGYRGALPVVGGEALVAVPHANEVALRGRVVAVVGERAPVVGDPLVVEVLELAALEG